MNLLETNLDPRETIVHNVMFEQGYDELLLDNLEQLRKTREITMKTRVQYKGHYITIRDAVGENLWCFLVELYGEYGVTLRSGWISDKKGFINFIEQFKEYRL